MLALVASLSATCFGVTYRVVSVPVVTSASVARSTRPATVSLAAGTSAAISALTNAVVATWVVLVPAVAVGAVGVPVRAGEAKGLWRRGKSGDW